MKGKYLVTTDSYFIAPDGRGYRAIWGDVEILSDAFLGIQTNRNATNWYAKIGSPEDHVIVAGCQIHYSIFCPSKPNGGLAEDWAMDATNGVKVDLVPSKIYITK